MCGIIGFWGKESSDSRDFVHSGLKDLSHRGPNSVGVAYEESVGYMAGHSRLAILDLSDHSKQPLNSACGRYLFTFNGELYNYLEIIRDNAELFPNTSINGDTLFLKHALSLWGVSIFNRINGMFACAVFDRKQNKLFLLRDFSGEKPLYYYHSENGLYYGSELTIFKKFFKELGISRIALDQYLKFGFTSEQSIINGIRKVLPNSILIVDMLGNEKVEQVREIPPPDHILDQDQLVEEFDHLFTESIRRQRVSDVPMAYLLSGGLDSSLVVGKAARELGNINTYSVIFLDDARYNEQKYSQQISKHFGTSHTEVSVDLERYNIVDDLLSKLDEPMADSSLIPTWALFSEIGKNYRVAIGGDGCDELFGGYHKYANLIRYKKISQKLGSHLSRFISSKSEFLPTGLRGRNLLQNLESENDFVALRPTFFNGRDIKRLLGQDFDSKETIYHSDNDRSSQIDLMTLMDWKEYLPNDILTKVDRASMLSSVESRAPFLDPNLVEFAFSRVPDFYKISGQEKKVLPKLLSKKILPKEFDSQRKMGFSFPLESWLVRKEIGDLLRDVLLDKDSVFRSSIVSRMLNSGSRFYKNSERIYALLVFETWRRKYKLEIK